MYRLLKQQTPPPHPCACSAVATQTSFAVRHCYSSNSLGHASHLAGTRVGILPAGEATNRSKTKCIGFWSRCIGFWSCQQPAWAVKTTQSNACVAARCSPVVHTTAADTGRSLQAFRVDAACIPRCKPAQQAMYRVFVVKIGEMVENKLKNKELLQI